MQETDVMANVNPALRDLSVATRTALLEGEVRTLQMKLQDIYSGRSYARTYPLVGPIGGESTLNFISTLHTWQRLDDKPRDIVINLNSYGEQDQFGASFTDSFAIIDAIRRFQSKGHRVIVQVTGTAALQAAAVMQIADERVITPNSWIMLSESSFPGFHSGSDAARDEIRFRKDLAAQADRFLLERSTINAETLKAKTEYEKQWWINAQEARELGLVDRVGVHSAQPFEMPEMPVTIGDDDSPADKLAKADILRNFLRAHIQKSELRALEVETLNPREIYFFGEVNHVSTGMTILSLQKFARSPQAEVDFYLNTPGGSVHDGLALMDVMQEVRAGGHKINVIVLGQAASMGGFILQAASHRVMGKNARILIHRISRIFRGTGSQLEEQEEQMAKLEAQALPLLAARSKLTVEEIQKRSEKNDWWIGSDEALELGLVDEVI